MPRRNTTPTGLDMGPAAYRYSPGDGHTYTWDGVAEYATVYRHRVPRPGDGPTDGLMLDPTSDYVYMGGCARTASAFSDHVDAWRMARAAGEVP